MQFKQGLSFSKTETWPTSSNSLPSLLKSVLLVFVLLLVVMSLLQVKNLWNKKQEKLCLWLNVMKCFHHRWDSANTPSWLLWSYRQFHVARFTDLEAVDFVTTHVSVSIRQNFFFSIQPASFHWLSLKNISICKCKMFHLLKLI